MKYNEAIDSLTGFLNTDLIVQEFGEIGTEQPFGVCSCSPSICRENPKLPKDGFGHSSGVYFLCSPVDEIYYIGKATKDNLHEEVWGKIKTPTVDNEGNRSYPKNYFLGKKLDSTAISNVENGNIKIGILVISNPILASLSEVFIQTLYCQRNNGKLPKLNSQIG